MAFSSTRFGQRSVFVVFATLMVLALVIVWLQRRNAPVTGSDVHQSPFGPSMGARPEKLDATIIDELEVLINGSNAIDDTVELVQGEEAQVKVTVATREGALPENHRADGMFIAYHPIGSSEPRSRVNEIIVPTHTPEQLHPGAPEFSVWPIRMEPGEYEIRFYLVLMRSSEEAVRIHYVAQGRINVIAAPDA